MPDWLLEKLAAERKMIEGAPLHFIFAVLITSLLGWLILRFFYRERLDGLNGLIGLYKDKFGTLKSDPNSPWANMRTSRLKKRVSEIAAGIDGLIDEHNNRARAMIGSATSVTLIGTLQETMAQYERNFKQDAILLRAEMKLRISSQGINDPGQPTGGGREGAAYGHPVNTVALKEVASDLRRLSMMLP